MLKLEAIDAKELVSGLTNDELAMRLKSMKEDIGPITPTTRPLYEKRLLKRLLLEQASTCTIPYCHRVEDIVVGSVNVVNGTSHGCTVNGVTSSEPSLAERLDDQVDLSAVCTTFYGVQLQAEACAAGGCFVFTNKEAAVKLIKEKKGGRFKAFSKRSEAEEFSRLSETLACVIPSTPTGNSLSQEALPVRAIPSESSSFRSLKFQELLPFRQAIEKEDVETIRMLAWSNPRFLIGSGDNPPILHEGSRYNALHICATKNKPISCKLILDTIENPRLAQLLYPDDSDEIRKSRINFFTDLYLNTPDKHLGETPLHYACKYGFVEMVAVLVSHPGTDKELKNIDGLTPRQVICSRVRNATNDLKQKILALFDNLYYVRVVGSADNVCPARVLPPWSPCVRLADDDMSSCQPCSPIKNCNKNSPLPAVAMYASPRDLPVALKAFAGPMSSELAEQVHSFLVSTPSTLPKERRRKYAQIKRGDCTKGLERIGREISRQLKVPWCEYWDFLDCIVDIESPDGLRRFEEHLRHRLKELMEALAIEEARARRADTSICQQLDQLHLNNSSSLSDHREIDAVPTTWPPSLAKNPPAHVPPVSDSDPTDGSPQYSATACSQRGGDDDGADSSASSDSFHTAPDDLDLEYSLVSEWPEGFGCESVDPVFVYGDKPCKTDVDVFRALETAEICPSSYPLVYRWWNAVLSYPEEIRNRWVPHERLKHGINAATTPASHHPISTSTPTHDDSFSNSFDISSCSSLSEDDSLPEYKPPVCITLCY